MALFDILRQLIAPWLANRGITTRPPEGSNGSQVTPPPTTSKPVEGPVEAQPAQGDVMVNLPPITPPVIPTPDRYGTFIIPDVYPPDLDDPHTPNVIEMPPFHVLPGLTVMDKEVVGCYIKASEGLGWGAGNERWFKDCWQEMDDVRANRPVGSEFFRGCYHFLRFQLDGAAQADYFLNLIEQAGGWKDGDLCPWVDVEEGGQGSWANDPKTGAHRKLEDIGNNNAAERARLAGEITKCVSAFVARVKQRYPGMRVGIYGRGVYRDLRMSNARFGGDIACNPAYTAKIPPMDAYGWPLADVAEWQLNGDGTVYAAGYPSKLPGWGGTDYSVVLNGAQRVAMSDVRRRCLAFTK